MEARPEGRTIVEEAPKQSNGSNGIVERAAQEVEGGMRALFFGLGGKGSAGIWTQGGGLWRLCLSMRLIF